MIWFFVCIYLLCISSLLPIFFTFQHFISFKFTVNTIVIPTNLSSGGGGSLPEIHANLRNNLNFYKKTVFIYVKFLLEKYL